MSKNRTHGSVWYRLRRGLSGIMCLALLLGLLPAGTVLSADAHWADPYAEQLVDWGVMRGDVSGNLNLGSAITRAEFVTLINRAYGYDKLGPTPFTDVSSRDWYYEDIGIAYNIGYFKGTGATKASPKSTLTREQAAVLLSRNLMLQETVGETLGFSDSRTLEEWSRGLIGAAVAEGMISGYTDGSFQPKRAITRGEVAAMLVRAIGTPIQEKGDYELGSVYGNVTINSSGVALRDTTILGNLYLTGGIDLGDVLLENVNVLGRIVISGGGESNASQSSVNLRNVQAKEMVVDSIDGQFVTIRAEGTTDIPTTSIRTNAYVDDSSWLGYGLSFIELDGESGTKLQLAGNIKEVRNMTPFSDLQIVQGSAEKVTVDEYATGSSVLVDSGAQVDELNLDVATKVTGSGDIKQLNVGAAGSSVSILPDKITIRPGITASINGQETNSTTAAEMSADPKLQAGYPKVKNIAPTTATAVFSTNKAGTVYWAISAVADGSVSEADLLENPAYGGNIYEKQAGKVTASKANTEYTASIGKLLPGGSYYISAILVDGQGNHSPLKVASFSTPDNTVPAFNKGYPVMTKNTTDIAQVTVMTNKNCQLYWALLPGGSTAPTPQEFKANSISGNWGYGSRDAVKNTTLPIKVNRVTLQEKTTYDLYLWLTDYNGANSSKVIKLTFTTPDETEPIVTNLTQTGATANTAQVTYSLNEPGTLYWAIVAEGNESFMPYDLDTTEARVKVETGVGAIARGSSNAARADTDVRFTISGLNRNTTLTTSYTLYYVAKDKDGNYSTPVGVKNIRTLDTEPPTVTQHFTETKDPKDDTKDPFADTAIRLVFSENVQGGTKEDKKFFDLYDDVLSAIAANDSNAITAARSKLAAALREHIELWEVPRDAQDHQVTERTWEVNTANESRDWTVDWRYARIEMDEKGQMVVVLPTVNPEPDLESGEMSALNLEGGTTYFFKLRNIYDLAYGSANAMGAVDLPTFTTVYAEVTLRSVNLSEIAAKDLVDSTNAIHPLKDGNLRVDLCMSVTPTSTSKVSDTVNWDLLLWSNTTVQALVYRQVGSGKWELLNGSLAAGASGAQPEDITVSTNVTRPGISLYGDVMYQAGQPQFPYVNNAASTIGGYLDEGVTYRYAIHFTKVGELSESSYDSWSQLVRMEAAVVAGAATDLRTLAGNVNGNYDDKINSGAVKSIGTAYNGNQVSDILLLENQFTDREVPKFETNHGYPTFTAGSSTLHMELNLNREGTVYYVVAPAGVIPTNAIVDNKGNTSPINKNTDGTADSSDESEAPTKGWTYLPTDGDDRDDEDNREHIAFVNGTYNYGGVAGTGFGLAAPTYSQIINPGFNNSRVKSGTRTYDGSTLEIDVTGLEPSKDLNGNGTIDTAEEKSVYYVYFVFQGNGNKYSQVECYRVTMDLLQTPSITVDGTNSIATMTPDAETEIYYALWETNKLPASIRTSTISYTENGTAKTMSVLEAIITPLVGRTGKTYFDEYASTSQKQAVLQRVNGTVIDTGAEPVDTWNIPHIGTAPGVPNHPDYAQAGESIQVDFESLMTSKQARYVLVAAVRHRYGGTTAEDYGFGGAQNLRAEDKTPPDFTGVNSKGEGLLEASGTLTGNSFSGTVSINFTENEVYYRRISDSKLFEVWPAMPTTDAEKDKAKGLIEVIGGSAVDNNHVSVQLRTGASGKGVTRSFTLKLNGILDGETIVFFQGGNISNGSNYHTTKTLTLTFDSSLTTKDYNTGNVGDDSYVPISRPGFRVTWR